MVCRRCRTAFTCSGYRPVINLTTETWTEAEVREATTGECPDCGLEARLTALLVDGAEFRLVHDS